MRKTFVAVATVAILALLVSPAWAKNGGGGRGGSNLVVAPTITLDQSDPHYGDMVSFSATYPPMREMALVWLACSQNGSNVYQSGGVPGGMFPLGGPGVSSAWTDGEAECVATLYYNTYQGQTQTGQVTLATTAFHVAA